MSTSLSLQLSLLTKNLSLSLGIILISFGCIGGIFNALIFSHKNFRQTSCGIYFFISSIFSIALILTGQIPRLIDVSSTSTLLTTFWYCKLKIYLTNSFSLIIRTVIVLTSLDRLLLCSVNAQTRAWCTPKIAIQILLITIIIAFILPVHVLVSYDLHLPYRACYSEIAWLITYDLTYQFIFVGILPSLLMSWFSLQLIYRLKSQRNRFARELHNRDRQFIVMTLGQILYYVIIHLPFLINITYNRITLYYTKTVNRVAIENFLSFLINSEWVYFYFAFEFFLNLCLSSAFRKQFILIFKKNQRNMPFTATVLKVAPMDRSAVN